MPTTSNFGWNTPADTDLVKDGAAAIRTLGNNIDASLVDLKGGTTGQVLAKASNADLDYTWSNVDPLTILDAKGDLISATAADTPARLAVGTNGQVLTADSATSTGLKWAAPASGGYTEIATGTIASGGTNITSIPGTYRDLVLVLKNTRTNTDGAPIALRVNADDTANRYRNLESSAGNNLAPDNSRWYLCSDQDSGTSDALIVVRLFDYANTTTWKMGMTTALSNDDVTTTNFSYLNEILAYNQTSAISQLNILAYSGTISAGTYTLYGVK